MKTFNNIAGTTSTDFSIGQGTGSEVQHYVLSSTGNNFATDREGNEVSVSGVSFYDMKVVAKNNTGSIVAKHLRGTISNTTVTRIEDIFQEDFSADVSLTSDGTLLSVNCTGSANFTIYITITKVVT
jgi:hypothetical protein